MVGMGGPTDKERQEAVKILAERHGITNVDEVYEDGEILLSRKAGGIHAKGGSSPSVCMGWQ